MTLGTVGAGTSSRLNQSDISDLSERSLRSSSCITRAVAGQSRAFWPSRDSFLPANLALWSSNSFPFNFSPIALVAHHVRSCRIRRGSERPSLSICLKKSTTSTSLCGRAVPKLATHSPTRPNAARTIRRSGINQ